MRIKGNWSSKVTRPFVFALALFLAACGGGSGGGGGSTIVSGWNPSERISNLRSNSIEMSTPSVALTSQGVGFAAWTERVFGSNCARTWVNRNSAGAWGVPTQIGIEQGVIPRIAANANGDAVLVWIERGFTTENCGGTVSPVLIGSADLSGNDSSGHARIAVNASGNAVALWRETRSTVGSVVSARYSSVSGTWTAPALVESNTQDADRPEVAIDVNGNAQAVWMQKIDGSETHSSGYTARFDPAAESWSVPELFEQSTESVFAPLVGMDDTGRALIAWEQTATGTGSIHAVHYAPVSGFGTPVHFAGLSVGLAVNSGGTALLASDVASSEPAPIFLGMSIRAAIFRP